MDMNMNIVNIVLGLVVLLFGRKLFWLFVGYVGFVAGFYYTRQFFGMEPGMGVLLIAIGVGIIGAILAVFLQKIAVTVAGFLAGVYLTTQLLQGLNFNPSPFLLLVSIGGGIIGAILLWAVFDYALILLSAFVGASAIITVRMFSPQINLVVFIVLFVLGLVVQATQFQKEEQSSRD
jgi:hypothetical protein